MLIIIFILIYILSNILNLLKEFMGKGSGSDI